MMRRLRNVLLFGIAAALVVVLALNPQLFATRKPAGGGHGHGHGHHGHDHGSGVEMTDEKIAAAGIELVPAGPAVLRDFLRLNGILQPNQEALVQVTPRFPGVVREVKKRIGDRVNRGDTLAVVESNQSLTAYELKAPIAGTIIDRQLSVGEYASEQKPAFVIADLSTVWVDFAVNRRDLARVRVGETVLVDPEDGAPPVETKIAYLSPVGSSDTQSALARAVAPNPDMRLRPGLFVTGKVLMSANEVPVAARLSALQTVENRIVVFVRNGKKFEARDVELGARDAEHAEVTFGLLEGDVYAAKNSFVIKAEIAKGSATHDH
jgi:cobalt-zinc-cadmium efflux system membrane fusion protein